jgi:hypothetical protein
MHMEFMDVTNATPLSISDAQERIAPVLRGVSYGMLISVPLWTLIILAVSSVT